MSSVFISNVDDYLAPSQACVNPLFSDSVNQHKEKANIVDNYSVATVTATATVPRRKLGQRGKRSLIPIVSKPEIAKVSIADCLACSGCVTTAETVLVEQHSLATLHTLLLSNNQSTNGTQQLQQQQIYMTLSPASLADLFRHCQIDTKYILRTKRQLVTFLSHTCQAKLVMDGQVPLLWSLVEASREFIHAYRTNHAPQTMSDKPISSIPISEPNHHGPLLSATCPALVCLVETSHTKAVTQLASTKSPMSMAGAFYKHTDISSSRLPICHIAIMPCHDKKLEASRKDFISNDNNSSNNSNSTPIPDVDLVLTTRELVQLLHEACGSSNISDVRLYLEQLEEAPMIDSVQLLESTLTNFDSTLAALVVLSTNDKQEYHPSSNDFYPYSSGGYADFIFQRACQELFDYTLPSGHVPWTPVERTQRQSARVANNRLHNQYHVSLFRHADDTYSCVPSTEASQPVLSFATAYGRQAMQRILQPQKDETLTLDYVEIMACPSGCLNGGGQVRLSDREAPSETRLRVIASQAMMEPSRSTTGPRVVDNDNVTPFGIDKDNRMHTQYHVVPKLQFTIGVTAGIAVQDTHW
jgi:iron only hydrogenase large subunit-like protein